MFLFQCFLKKKKMTVYSNKNQLEDIATYLSAYMRIPYFQDDTIPGKVMEKIFSLVHSAEQLVTYDYVDVCRRNDVGWQVKSTKSSTPLTWKRAKIPESERMIRESEKSAEARQRLGDAIIDFCNKHAYESLVRYQLKEIGYSRLIMHDDGSAVYFEKLISTNDCPDIFNKENYIWNWSFPKKTSKKEQLTALHGTDLKTGKKAFAWHGKGENQLHFSGESDWWPDVEIPSKIGQINFSEDCHAMAFMLPSDKVSWSDLVEFLEISS